ncbi:MAG: ERF family protein [bacterium]
MKFSDSTKNLIIALVKAQAGFESAKKSSKNPFFNSKYADLAEVIESVKKPLSDNGLAFIQTVEKRDGKIEIRSIDKNGIKKETIFDNYALVTTLFHESGESIISEYPILTDKEGAQGFGAGVTYARRYALQTLFGIPADDDDGNVASSGRQAAQSQKPAAQPTKQAEQKPQDISGIDFFKNISNIKVEENESGDIFITGSGAYPYRTSLIKLGFIFSPESKSWVKKAQVAA